MLDLLLCGTVFPLLGLIVHENMYFVNRLSTQKNELYTSKNTQICLLLVTNQSKKIELSVKLWYYLDGKYNNNHV